MTDLVPADEIERIVGCSRDPNLHIGKAVSAEETVYILHSQQCKDTTPDLRACRFSLALDQGIDVAEWVQDVPHILTVHEGRLVPFDEAVRVALREEPTQ